MLTWMLTSSIALATPMPVQDIDVQFCWSASSVDPDCPILTATLYDDGTLQQTWITYPTLPFLDGPVSGTGTWRLKARDRRLQMTLTDGGSSADYDGWLDAGSGCWEGTMTSDSGVVVDGVFEACPA